MTIRALIAISILGLGIVATPAIAAPSQHPFAQIFMRVCVGTYAQPAEVSEQAKRFGLKEIKGQVAEEFLAGHAGQAWSGEIDKITYAVALLADGSCSVFAKEGDANLLQEAVESWLPPADSGFAVTKEPVDDLPGLQSTHYVIQGGKDHEEWLLTTCQVDLPNPLRAIVTYLRR